jgi:hypothetical protein
VPIEKAPAFVAIGRSRPTARGAAITNRGRAHVPRPTGTRRCIANRGRWGEMDRAHVPRPPGARGPACADRGPGADRRTVHRPAFNLQGREQPSVATWLTLSIALAPPDIHGKLLIKSTALSREIPDNKAATGIGRNLVASSVLPPLDAPFVDGGGEHRPARMSGHKRCN